MRGSRRTSPRIINTPQGPKERTRMAGESMERRQRRTAFTPTKRRPMFIKDREERIRDRDMETKRTERMQRREEKKQTFGDSFREQRKDERRLRRGMPRDRKGFFGRAPKRPTPDTRDRKPIENFTVPMGMADGSPESMRKRKEAFEEKVNNLSPERRKEFDENRLRFRFTEEERGRPRL